MAVVVASISSVPFRHFAWVIFLNPNSNPMMCVCVCYSLSCVQFFVTPWTEPLRLL